MSELKTLRWRMDRRAHLLRVREEQMTRRRELEKKIFDLKYTLEKEQADVEKLEKPTLTALLSRLMGDQEEKLEQERREACAAQLKLEAAKRELEVLKAELDGTDAALAVLAGCEAEYELAYERKAEELRTSAAPEAGVLLDWERDLADQEHRIGEFREAISAANSAKAWAKRVTDSLKNAENYSTWDMLGGGLLVDMAKHSELDDAQAGAEQLQASLRKLRTELVDVHIEGSQDVGIGNLDRFADWFFDNFFLDWGIRDKIWSSQERVRKVQYQIDEVLHRLDTMLAQEERKCEALKKRMEELVVEAKI